MKSQKTVWLAILVLGIWGTIGYKIFQSLEVEDIEAPPNSVKKEALAVESKDNYPLQLNYTDPFLKKVIEVRKPITTTPRIVKQPVQPVIVAPTIIIDWNKIEYLGLMNNASRKSNIASLRIDGVDYIAKQGEVIDGFTILNIHKDSVQLAFETQTKYIKKKK